MSTTTIYCDDHYSDSIKSFEVVGETDKFWKIAVKGWRPGDPDQIRRQEKKPNEFRTWIEANDHLRIRVTRELLRAQDNVDRLRGIIERIDKLEDPTK